jgi:hypothetical protein
VSVDLGATLGKSITLGAVVDESHAILAALLGVAAVPDLAVFVDREYDRGVRVGPGRRLGVTELAATIVGDPIAPEPNGMSGSVHFEVDLPSTGDGVFFTVIDHTGEAADGHRHVVLSPNRTCVGVVLATSLALAAALRSNGDYVDDEIRMLRPPVRDPVEVIGRTRLSGVGNDFAARCEQYLRQFPGLGGWPPDRSMRSAEA